ncbi:MAG: hypothetical protein ACHQAX_05445 [Gammaproteobacteria bacterium]
MITDKDLAALNNSIQDYDPRNPLQMKISGELVLIGYLNGNKARVNFLYEIPQGSNHGDFEAILQKNGITAQQLFNMFCAQWKENSKFIDKKSIDSDYLDKFRFDSDQNQYILDVKVQAIDKDKIRFVFKGAKDSEPQELLVKTTTKDEKIRRVESIFMMQAATSHKQAIYCRANKVYGHKLPAQPNPALKLNEKSRQSTQHNFVDNFKKSIASDTLFPNSMRLLIEEDAENTDKDTALKRMKIKKILADSLDDDSCMELKEKMNAALDRLIKKYTPETKALTETFALLMKKRKENALSDEEFQKQAKQLQSESALEVAKGNKLKNFLQIKQYLDKVFFPYVKQGATVYLFLEHVVDFLYDYDETNPEQELYQLAKEWMVRYNQSKLASSFNIDEIGNINKKYLLSVDAKSNILQNSFDETAHTEAYVQELTDSFRDLIELQDAFLATPPTHDKIHFTEDTATRIVTIFVDNGFQLKFKADQFFADLRASKLKKAQAMLLETYTDSLGSDISVFSQEPQKAFRMTMNPLIDSGSLSNALTVPGSGMNLFQVLSVEEKISWLVSLWIIECQFYADDNQTEINKKTAAFKVKVEKFLNENCGNENAAFKREHLLESIAFYVAKNTGERLLGALEPEARQERLTIEHRKSMIKAIYGNKLPNVVHNENDEAFTRSVENDSKDVNKLVEQEYLLDFYEIARPFGTSVYTNEDRNKLVELTDLLMALNNASFLDSNGVSNAGHVDRPALLKRRQCLIELIFHVLVEKIDPIAKKIYEPNVYLQYMNTFMNAEYAPKVEPIVKTAYVHVNAFLDARVKNRRKHKKVSVQIESADEIRAVSVSTGRDRTSSDGSDDFQTSLERSNHYSAITNSLKEKLKQIDTYLPHDNTLREALLPAERLEKLRSMTEALGVPANEFLDGTKTQVEFSVDCKKVEDELDNVLASLPHELTSIKSERSRLVDQEISELNAKISKIEQDLKNSKVTKIEPNRFIPHLQAKVKACEVIKSDYVEGHISTDQCSQRIEKMNNELDGCVDQEENRLAILSKERSLYRIDELRKIQAQIKLIKDAYYSEENTSDESAEKMVVEIFGNAMFDEVAKDFERLQTNRNYYERDLVSANTVDQGFIELSSKLAALQSGLQHASEKANDFFKVKVAYTQYIDSSLIQEHKASLDNYIALREKISNRGFISKIRSFFGFSQEKAENDSLKQASHHVKVLAMMISVDSESNVTNDKLGCLKDSKTLYRKFIEVSSERKRLQSMRFPPSEKIALYLDVESKLTEQLSQLTLHDRVTAIKNEKNQSKREALFTSLIGKPETGEGLSNKKTVWSEMLTQLPTVSSALTALRDLFLEKKKCESEVKACSRSMLPLSDVVGFSEGTRSRSSSQSSQESLGQGEEQRNREASVAFQ